MTIVKFLTILVAVRFSVQQQPQQQMYTFPLSPGQNSVYSEPQYNNVYNSRFPYIPQASPQQFSFNPVARVQVQQDPSFTPQFNPQHSHSPSEALQHQQTRLSFPRSASEYQVDQRVPLPIPPANFQGGNQFFESSSFSSPSPIPQPSGGSQSLQGPSAQQGPTRLVPDFLKSASSSDQDKFYEIVQHPTWSAVEKNRRIEEFMKTMTEERQTMYTNHRQDISKELEDRRRNVDQAVGSMSKGAFEEFQKVVSIMRDPTQPENQKLRRIEEIYSKLPDAIRKEFDTKLKGF